MSSRERAMKARPVQRETQGRSLSDDELMLMCRNGEAAAFDLLFERHYRSVYGFARSMLGESGGTDEVLQDTFLAAVRAAGSYVPQGKFKAWLLQIARNRCLNRLQARKARQKLVEETGFRLVEPEAHDPAPSDILAGDECEQVIRAAIAMLPDRQREAITLYALEQLSYQQIADVLQVPINTVKTLIRRARIALAKTLMPYRQEMAS
jgi:RNA polymerase sigma-70 factor (ECF subfamily)